MSFGKKAAPEHRRRTGNQPGQSAREKQRELARAAPISTFFTRLLGMHTEESAWGQGADGEEYVGGLLETLKPQWHVEHDVRVGARWTNLDHLLIGPPGVFVLNTKTLSGDVWVGGDNVMVGGYRKDFVQKQEREALHVRDKLVRATRRRSLWVQGVLVLAEGHLTLKEQPSKVVVLRAAELLPGCGHSTRSWGPGSCRNSPARPSARTPGRRRHGPGGSWGPGPG
jgi:hypothetical protein